MNTYMDNQAQALKENIDSAFACVKYPGDDNIGLQQFEEGRQAADIFKGQHWKSLSLDRLRGEYFGPILSTLTPRAFHFFLPGFLLLMIESRVDAEVMDVILFAITPTDKGILESLREPVRRRSIQAESYKAKKIKLPSLDQKKAILACLTHMENQFSGYTHEPLRRARRFWEDQVRGL